MPADPLALVLRLVTLILVAFAIFATWPGIDLAVSGVFHVPGKGFPVQDMPGIDLIRRAIWGASIAMLMVAVVGLVVSLLRGAPVARLQARDWGFILALYAVGSGLVVETVLKPFWGRARPADVIEFGGTRGFTAPNEIAHQCLKNCSFTAGEVAGAVALALALSLILAHWRPSMSRRMRRAARVGIVALPVVAGAQRIAAGRHFLSDVVFSVLVMALVAVLLAWLLRLRNPF